MDDDAKPANGSEGSFRDRMHALLRESILDAAAARASEVDWSVVRLADIADDVGVSRQTIYNEFGTKAQLGGALFEREMSNFLMGILRAAGESEELVDALRSSLTWILAEARSHAILQRSLRAARDGGAAGETLLPLMTVNAHVVLLPARTALVDHFESRWPSADPSKSIILVDLMIRHIVSFVIQPSDLAMDVVVDMMVTMVEQMLDVI